MSDEPEQTAEDPDRVVDPPEVSSADVGDAERSAETERVRIEQTATLTLPSGSSYALNAGQVLELSPEDAAYVIGQGYGSKADELSGE